MLTTLTEQNIERNYVEKRIRGERRDMSLILPTCNLWVLAYNQIEISGMQVEIQI